MRLTFLLACLFSIFGFNGFGQSLYQDAKALAKSIEPSKNQGGDVWFKMTNSISFIHSEWEFNSLNEKDTIRIEQAHDYLVVNCKGYPDRLFIYRNKPYTILFNTIIKYNFCILRIKGIQNGKANLSIISPSGEIIESRVGDFIGNEIFLGSTGKGSYAIYEGEPDEFTIKKLTNNKIDLHEYGYYLFPSLSEGGTLKLIGNQDTVASIRLVKDNLLLFNFSHTDSILAIPDHKKPFLIDKNKMSIKYQPFIVEFYPYQIGFTFQDLIDNSYHKLLKQYGGLSKLTINLLPDSSSRLHVINSKHLGRYMYDSMSPDSTILDTFAYRIPPQHDYNELYLFKGKNLIKNININRSESVIISYKKNDESIGLQIDRHFYNNYIEKAYFKKRVSIKVDSVFMFMFDNIRLGYIYTENSNRYLSELKKNLIVSFWSKTLSFHFDFYFDVYELKKDGKKSESTISMDSLFSKTFSEGSLYKISLKLEDAKKRYPDIDFTDIYFLIYFGNEIEINWYPAINPTIEILVHNKLANIFYSSVANQENYIIPIPIYQKDSLPIVLGIHSQLKRNEMLAPNLWGDISVKYRNNPFLGKYLKKNLAQSAFDQIPNIPNDTLAKKISITAADHYPWQQVVFENRLIEADEQVSYENVVNTYRTPITTASDNLQAASEQFGGESKKLKRGLSTADLAAGLSDFIVERAQEELNVTFLSRLREGILRDTAEFSILFPQTRKMLSEFKIVQYRTLLDFAKNAFIHDLRNLGLDFPKLFQLPRYSKIKNDPKVYNIFLLYDIANKVYQGMPIDTVLLHLHSRLQERKTDLGKSVNERIAKSIKVDTLTRDSLSELVRDFQIQLKKFEKNRSDLMSAYSARWIALFPDSNKTDQQAALHLRAEWKTDTNTRKYILAEKNLKGDPDYPYVLEHLPFNLHKSYFRDTIRPLEIISAGIDLSRTLLSLELSDRDFIKLEAIKDGLAGMETLRRELNAEKAKRTLRLSSYIPVFERLRSLMIQRVCLNLALASELALNKKSRYFKERDRQSLIYFQKVIEAPQNYQLFNWGPIDRFNSKLKEIGMDTCTSYPDPQVLGQMAVFGPSGKILNEYEERLKLAGVMDSIENIQIEMENASAFLSKMANAIHDEFINIIRHTVRQGYMVKKNADLIYYNRFLFSRELTDGGLTFDYDSLFKKINKFIQEDTGVAKNNGELELEIYKSTRWSSQELKRKMVEYDSIRTATIIIQHPSGSAFLDYYDKTLKFDESAKDIEMENQARIMESKIESTLLSIAALYDISDQFKNTLDRLERDSASDLLQSLKQTEELATLTEITLQWLYAFQDGSVEREPLVVRDSIVQHIKQDTLGKEITYDNLQVIEKKIDPGVNTNRWITPKKFNQIMEDTLLRKAFLGLLYQRLSAIEGGSQYAPANMALLATKFMNTIYDIDDRREILKYKKANNQTLRFEDYYPFIKSTVDMLNIVLETPVQAGGASLKDRFATLKDVPKISDEVLSLFENVFAENYPNAIRNVVQLLSITWGLDEETSPKKTKKDTESKDDKATRMLKPVLTHKDNRDNKKVKSAILLYGSFMANMVGAQTPDQVKAAIRAVALPAGSSSLKRNTRFNVSVNSYLGAGFYGEKYRAEGLDKRAHSTVGLSVPVGITASIGDRGKKHKMSYSFFAPILDLGAITAYRLDQNNIDAALPEPKLGNLVAPGGYILLNFPKTPFTVGAGLQYGPQLREIKQGANTITSSAFRFGIIATIDVPIFNIYTSKD